MYSTHLASKCANRDECAGETAEAAAAAEAASALSAEKECRPLEAIAGCCCCRSRSMARARPAIAIGTRMRAGTPALKAGTSRTVGWNLGAGLGLGRALRGTESADEHGGADQGDDAGQRRLVTCAGCRCHHGLRGAEMVAMRTSSAARRTDRPTE
jgi:hypothetical protein